MLLKLGLFVTQPKLTGAKGTGMWNQTGLLFLSSSHLLASAISPECMGTWSPLGRNLNHISNHALEVCEV